MMNLKKNLKNGMKNMTNTQIDEIIDYFYDDSFLTSRFLIPLKLIVLWPHQLTEF